MDAREGSMTNLEWDTIELGGLGARIDGGCYDFPWVPGLEGVGRGMGGGLSP